MFILDLRAEVKALRWRKSSSFQELGVSRSYTMSQKHEAEQEIRQGKILFLLCRQALVGIIHIFISHYVLLYSTLQ